jgi:16S rRNA G527 N7-methylase RsmG
LSRTFAAGTPLLAMKGVEPLAEIADLPNTVKASEIIRLDVPHIDSQRHLVLVTPV